MKNIVIDSDIFVDQLRGFSKAKEFFNKVKSVEFNPSFSAITESELISGKECNNVDKKQKVLDLLSLASKVNVNNKIALLAGDYRRRYNAPLIDAIIAATAYFMKASLISRNSEHYKKIKDIKLYKPY